MKKIYLICLTLLLSCSQLFSQTITNVGSKITVTDGIYLNFDNLHNSGATSILDYDTDLSISGYWTNISPATFVQGPTGTVTLDGTSQQPIASGGSSFRDLTIDNSSGILLSDNMEVSTSLTLTDGIVNTNSNLLLFQSAATSSIGNEGSFVHGEMRKAGATEFIFPCGDVISRDLDGDLTPENYVIWSPLKSAPIASTNVTVEYFFDNSAMPDWWEHGGNMDASLHHVSGLEYYKVNSSTNLTNVTLYWNDNDHAAGEICEHGFCDGDNVFTTTDLVVAYWDDSKWVNAGANTGSSSLNHDDGYLTSASVIPFVNSKGDTYITYGSLEDATPLPVDLLNFVSECGNSQVELSWETASEVNNRGFVIEKSLDAESFEEIGFVDGNKNSNQLINYIFIDENSEKTGAYYRLKQIDYDGEFKYTEPIFAYCSNYDTEPELSIYPNPFKQNVNIVVRNLPINDKTEVCVYNMLGILIYKTIPNTIDGNFELDLDLEYLSPGMYVVKVLSGDYVGVTRIEKN